MIFSIAQKLMAIRFYPNKTIAVRWNEITMNDKISPQFLLDCSKVATNGLLYFLLGESWCAKRVWRTDCLGPGFGHIVDSSCQKSNECRRVDCQGLLCGQHKVPQTSLSWRNCWKACCRLENEGKALFFPWKYFFKKSFFRLPKRNLSFVAIQPTMFKPKFVKDLKNWLPILSISYKNSKIWLRPSNFLLLFLHY